MADEAAGRKLPRPSDGKSVMFTRVDPGLPGLFYKTCDLLGQVMDADERRPPASNRTKRQEYAFREIVLFAAENYPQAFRHMLQDPNWEDAAAVRAELEQIGLGEFSAAVATGWTDTPPARKRRR